MAYSSGPSDMQILATGITYYIFALLQLIILFVCTVCLIIFFYKRCCTDASDQKYSLYYLRANRKELLDLMRQHQDYTQRVHDLQQTETRHTTLLEDIKYELKVLNKNQRQLSERLNNLENSLSSKRDSITYQSILLDERRQEHQHYD